jgi:hypothetical protein
MAVVLLIACAGCDSFGVPRVSSSQEETAVRGTVRVRGKPVDNGSVVFNAANVRRPQVPLRSAPINKDGTYSAKTLVGENSIQVSCKELMTAKNHMFAENEFFLMAKSGENLFDIDIPPGPEPPTATSPQHSKRSRR